MSRTGITYAEVAEAMNRLTKKGITPTIDRIRQALGNTGSNGTISKHMKKHTGLVDKGIKKTTEYWNGYNQCQKDIIMLIKNRE